MTFAGEDTVMMDGTQTFTKRIDQHVGRRDAERTLLKTLRERFAFDVLGHEKDDPFVVDPELEQSDDRPMVEGLEDCPFPAKSPAHRLVGEILGVQHLNRYFGSLDTIERFEHITHRPTGYFRDQLVAAGQRGSKANGF